MNTRSIFFFKENQKKKHKHHLMSPSRISFLKCTLSIGRYISYQVFRVFLKTLRAQCGN